MGRLTPWKLLSDQWSTIPRVSEFSTVTDLAGKTVVVTGANVGIGLEIARHFATMDPARLIIGCRNAQRADNAIESIRSTTGCQSLEFWSLDLADFSSICAFADRFEKDGNGRLDLLVENAGIQALKYSTTVDGWEKTLQVNHLGTSLLAILLLPFLLKSDASSPAHTRLVLVASEAHFKAGSLPESDSPAILEKLNDKPHNTRITTMMRQYCVTKLLNVFFTRSLAQRLPLPPTGTLTVTCVNPGFCKSELLREVHGILFLIIRFGTFLLARTAEVGSRNVVWAALHGERGEVHGRYTSRCMVEEESDFALSKKGSEVENRIWEETIQVLSKVDPRVKHIISQHLTEL